MRLLIKEQQRVFKREIENKEPKTEDYTWE